MLETSFLGSLYSHCYPWLCMSTMVSWGLLSPPDPWLSFMCTMALFPAWGLRMLLLWHFDSPLPLCLSTRFVRFFCHFTVYLLWRGCDFLVIVAQPWVRAFKSELGPKLEQQSSPFPGGQRLVDSLGNAFPMDGDADIFRVFMMRPDWRKALILEVSHLDEQGVSSFLTSTMMKQRQGVRA